MVVVDVDMSARSEGQSRTSGASQGVIRDAVMTPQGQHALGRGGMVVYAASKAYKNAVAIAGTGIDVRSLGGYIVLPMLGNGREWRRPLIGVKQRRHGYHWRPRLRGLMAQYGSRRCPERRWSWPRKPR